MVAKGAVVLSTQSACQNNKGKGAAVNAGEGENEKFGLGLKALQS